MKVGWKTKHKQNKTNSHMSRALTKNNNSQKVISTGTLKIYSQRKISKQKNKKQNLQEGLKVSRKVKNLLKTHKTSKIAK